MNTELLAIEASYRDNADNAHILTQNPATQLVPSWALQMQQAQQQMLQTQQQMLQMQQQMAIQIHNNQCEAKDQSDWQSARTFNSLQRNDSVLEALAQPRPRQPTAQSLVAGAPLPALPAPGLPHPLFPATVAAARDLTDAHLDTLLQAYDVPVPVLVPDKRETFNRFIGVF